MDAPDVAMLCAIAQHEEALLTLRSIGGLHALSLVAAEGNVSALVALKKACSGDANVLLEGDTYLSMMNLISSSEHDAAWRAASPTWRKLESSAFELLGSLCVGSAKGRNAVSAADSCEGCVSRAVEIVTALAGISKSPEIVEEEEEEVAAALEATDDDSEEEENENEKPELDAPPPSFSAIATKLPKSENDAEEFELGVAACGFLSSLSTTKKAKKALCGDADCIQALSQLATTSASEELQYSCLNVLVALAPSVSSEGPLSASGIGEVLKSVLESEKKFKTTTALNANRVYFTAVSGISGIFDLLSEEQQKSDTVVVSSLFMKSVKKCIVTRATTRDEERAYSAELTYALTTILLLARGKSFVDEIFSKDLMASLVHLIQWHQDPKTNVGNTNQRFWDASVTNCLLLLSSTLWRPDESLAKAGIDLPSLAGTALMLARPGKAPRKAIDLKSALTRIVAGTDAGAAVAAQRVLDRLF